MSWRGREPIDYPRLYRMWAEHRRRFAQYVEAHGLLCQECGGAGGETDVILDDGTGPWDECGWCLGTGKTTRWLRGQWLRWKAEEKRKAKERKQAANAA